MIKAILNATILSNFVATNMTLAKQSLHNITKPCYLKYRDFFMHFSNKITFKAHTTHFNKNNIHKGEIT